MNDRSGEEPKQSGEGAETALSTIGDWLSGIPKVFQKPLAKAGGRLLLGLVEWPTVVLEARASDIRHRQRMREKLREALTKEAIKSLPAHVDLVERAVEHLLNDLLVKQQNREKVLKFAVEELRQHSPADSPLHSVETGLDDDWLNAFAAFAERASSERLRQLFGRVLAGEIRKPNSYSLFTLDVLSKIGPADAALIVSVAPFVLESVVVNCKAMEAAVPFHSQLRLHEIGVLAPPSSNPFSGVYVEYETTNDDSFEGKPSTAFVCGTKVIIISTGAPRSVRVDIHALTTAGTQILGLHVCDLSEVMLTQLATKLAKDKADLRVADFVGRDDGKPRYRNERLIRSLLDDAS